jgi:hypothetical protein
VFIESSNQVIYRIKRASIRDCNNQHGDAKWLPSIKRWQAGSWAETEIAHKAVKSDDTEVNMFPWHQSIALIFPFSRIMFLRLTHSTMRRWRKNVITSFFPGCRLQRNSQTLASSCLKTITPRKRRAASASSTMDRLFMRMKASPACNAVRHYYLGKEFARGDPIATNNPMGYNRIRFNLQGMECYDPFLPKVMKWSKAVAGDVITFVDDVRIVGYSKENCHGGFVIRG